MATNFDGLVEAVKYCTTERILERELRSLEDDIVSALRSKGTYTFLFQGEAYVITKADPEKVKNNG